MLLVGGTSSALARWAGGVKGIQSVTESSPGSPVPTLCPGELFSLESC